MTFQHFRDTSEVVLVVRAPRVRHRCCKHQCSCRRQTYQDLRTLQAWKHPPVAIVLQESFVCTFANHPLVWQKLNSPSCLALLLARVHPTALRLFYRLFGCFCRLVLISSCENASITAFVHFLHQHSRFVCTFHRPFKVLRKTTNFCLAADHVSFAWIVGILFERNKYSRDLPLLSAQFVGRRPTITPKHANSSAVSAVSLGLFCVRCQMLQHISHHKVRRYALTPLQAFPRIV